MAIDIRVVEVRYLYRHGHLVAFGLFDDDLFAVAPSLRFDRDKEILAKLERVGLVTGEVHDWSKEGGHSLNPKIHWDCPNCGQRWFTDFAAEMPNPIFESSGCNCVPYWLISWNADQLR